jgi:hypothetical protein
MKVVVLQMFVLVNQSLRRLYTNSHLDDDVQISPPRNLDVRYQIGARPMGRSLTARNWLTSANSRDDQMQLGAAHREEIYNYLKSIADGV